MDGLTRRAFLATVGAMAAWPARGAAAASPDRPRPFRASYGPFECVSETPLDAAGGLFDELAALQRELTRTLAIPPARDPIQVLLFANEDSHRHYLKQAYPRVPYRRALYVRRSGQGTVYAYLHPEIAVDLRHECTHALLHSNLPMVPLWLDEGLAEYFEVSPSQRAFGHPHLARLKWDLRLGLGRSLETLERQHELSDMGTVEYRFSWAWVHFMLHGPQSAHQQLVEYLADIRRGNPPGMLSDRLVRAVPDLESRMRRHFKYWRD